MVTHHVFYVHRFSYYLKLFSSINFQINACVLIPWGLFSLCKSVQNRDNARKYGFQDVGCAMNLSIGIFKKKKKKHFLKSDSTILNLKFGGQPSHNRCGPPFSVTDCSSGNHTIDKWCHCEFPTVTPSQANGWLKRRNFMIHRFASWMVDWDLFGGYLWCIAYPRRVPSVRISWSFGNGPLCTKWQPVYIILQSFSEEASK